MELQPNPLAIRALFDDELARLRATHADLPKSPDSCITCRGRKTFLWKNEAGEPVEWKCNCEEQFLLHRHLLNAGIDLHYQRLSWMDATGVEPAAQEVVLDYADHADQYFNAGLGLVLHGTRGTGKTLLSTLLIKMLIGQGHKVYFVTFQELIDHYVSGWRNPEDRAWFDKRIRNASVLGIDDVGRENKSRIDMVESMFDHVIRPRVAASRPTIVTTNKSLDGLNGLYQGNVMSLLTEACLNHEFKGEDYRPVARQSRVDDARAGLTRPIVLG